MLHSASFLRLDRVTPPFEQISHNITAFVEDVPMLSTRRADWNFLGAVVTFRDPTHAVLNIQGTELAPTIEEYRTLIGRTAVSHNIVEPNLSTTRLVLVSRLLRLHRSQLHAELANSGGIEIVTTKLLYFIEPRVREVRGDIFQVNLCHAVLLLNFGTLLFPSAADRIDVALASVILQVVGGRGYEVALVSQTIWLLDCVTRTTDRKLRESPVLLQIWLQSHASPFCLVPPVLFFNRSESIISRYRTLIGRTAVSHGIVEPNLRTTRLVLVSRLLKVHKSQLSVPNFGPPAPEGQNRHFATREGSIFD
ncbi:hypothetical protein CRG98_008728 [Punica granatum]|uniref:DUF7745 domain-containing protein n=1 Tax=Punica granatum TaxID=22663 RepID=A0A2I0KQU3_PUNGR|nr:hypothetical protein CRG98_008728 [Punica granatum]